MNFIHQHEVIFIFLCFVAGAFGRSKSPYDVIGEGPVCPIADPLTAPAPIPINVNFLPIFEITRGSAVINLIAEGLSTLHYKVHVHKLFLNATFELNLERAVGNATYTASGIIDASPISEEVIPFGVFTGSGLGKISVEGLHVKGSCILHLSMLDNKATARTLNLEILSFRSLAVDFGPDWRIGGQPIDWPAFNAGIKEGFDREYAAKKAEVDEKFRLAVNTVIGQYIFGDLLEIIEGIGGSDCP